MFTSTSRRLLATACAAATVTFGVAGTASAATAAHHGSPSHHGGHSRQNNRTCATTTTVSMFAFNDFHGRLATSSPDTAVWAATLEDLRSQAGAKNSIVLSSGDNVGASLFASQIQNDVPTINALNALRPDYSTMGNHELDKGWDDFTNRVEPMARFPYVAANVMVKGTKKHAVRPYKIITRDGLRIAVVGAVTGDLHSLVSPTIFDHVDVVDPVTAVNQVTDEIYKKKLADVVVASYHAGGPLSAPATLADNEAAGPEFKHLVNDTDKRIAAVFTAHTHSAYAYDAPIPGTKRTRPVIQSGSYAAYVGDVTLTIDSNRRSKGFGTICASTEKNVAPPKLTGTDRTNYIAKFPRAVQVDSIVNGALASATQLGSQVVASASAPITRGLSTTGASDDRSTESAATKLVAQMFYDTLSNGNKNFIGVQNPGGTRADLPAGDITYAGAAAVLPFANTLMTTQITGAQFKTMLEEQWQTNADGTVPARPYLQLGLSKNVSYTYDESLPAGSRITSITINGAAMDPSATYTVGSGNFLIQGGDNFRVLAQGKNAADTGKSDLDSWVTWLKAQGKVSPSFAKQAVSVHVTPTTLTAGQATSFSVGVPASGGITSDTLDERSTGAPKNTSLVATLNGTQVGTATVTNGGATISVTVPAGTAAGAANLVLTASDSGTVVTIPVTIK